MQQHRDDPDEIVDAIMSDDPGDAPGGQDRGEIVYDCGAWAGETRRLLAGMLDNAGVIHAWQGPSLTVRVVDEERVDQIVEELLGSTTAAALPEGAESVAFATSEWSVAMQTTLATALAEDDVAYEWNEHGDLVVLAEQEEAVSLLLDEIAEEDGDFVSSDDGVALHALLGDVFQAASKLARRPRDAGSLVTMADSADLMLRLALPFGFERQQWTALVERVASLRELIADGDDDEVAEASAVVRDSVRPYV